MRAAESMDAAACTSSQRSMTAQAGGSRAFNLALSIRMTRREVLAGASVTNRSVSAMAAGRYPQRRSAPAPTAALSESLSQATSLASVSSVDWVGHMGAPWNPARQAGDPRVERRLRARFGIDEARQEERIRG